MMLDLQKHLFRLPEDIHYINCAYMSPLLRRVEEKGIEGILRKRNPAGIRTADFFEEAAEARTKFGQLVGALPAQVALIPSVSYGITSAIRNVAYRSGQHALVVADEFPSSFYAATRWCRDHGAALKTIGPAPDQPLSGHAWNERVLEAIGPRTALVLVSSVHWMNGTRFDLASIGQRCREVGATFVVDGTQSVGALPVDVQACSIDALVCASYKWLMGPYATGLAYYSEAFNEGQPLEETWMNKANAPQFSQLTDYTEDYLPGASRYNVGEYSNFVLLPMVHAALDQLLAWQPARIQAYCQTLTQPLVSYLQQHDMEVAAADYRAHHLLGLILPEDTDQAAMLEELQQRKLYVSVRGRSMRISPHVYNTPEDIAALIEALDEVVVR